MVTAREGEEFVGLTGLEAVFVVPLEAVSVIPVVAAREGKENRRAARMDNCVAERILIASAVVYEEPWVVVLFRIVLLDVNEMGSIDFDGRLKIHIDALRRKLARCGDH